MPPPQPCLYSPHPAQFAFEPWESSNHSCLDYAFELLCPILAMSPPWRFVYPHDKSLLTPLAFVYPPCSPVYVKGLFTHTTIKKELVPSLGTLFVPLLPLKSQLSLSFACLPSALICPRSRAPKCHTPAQCAPSLPSPWRSPRAGQTCGWRL